MVLQPDKSYGKNDLLDLYQRMLVIRRCEEQLVKSYRSGEVYGAYHSYIGEEAVAAGVCGSLRVDDVVVSTHRGHGHALAKGVPPREVIAELFGRASGCSGGRGGSMHLFKPEVGLYGTTGVVGPSILLVTGAAYALSLLRTDRIAVAFFGDGAVNNGAFHEGINLASLWRLPAVFVCENNCYATEMPFEKSTRQPDVAARGQCYGLPGVQVDGNDVLAVHHAANDAVQRARSGDGPTLIECKTYRLRAHAEGQRLLGYRTQEEIDLWKGRDPIMRLREQLLVAGKAAEDEIALIDSRVMAMIDDAVAFAQNAPWPDPATVTDHVYSN
jgi:2-oxoisovalerate dehydrogenase E1 component